MLCELTSSRLDSLSHTNECNMDYLRYNCILLVANVQHLTIVKWESDENRYAAHCQLSPITHVPYLFLTISSVS